MLLITILVLMGTAMCQEPVNHAVSQPVARQVYASQPAAPNAPAAQQPYAPVTYFAFEPMVDIPHPRTHQAAPVHPVLQPVVDAKRTPAQPTAPREAAATCGCGK